MLCAPLLMGGACEKKKPAEGTSNASGAVEALERADPSKPVDQSPLDGIDTAKLSDDRKKLFFQLVDSLESPCGKAHSLRTSFKSDTSCKQAPYAVRYVLALVEDEATDELARKEYKAKYIDKHNPVKIDVSKAPRVGTEDAPIRIVEYFDYACPHCREFKTQLDRVAAQYGTKVVEYFKMYPIGSWPQSKSAGQAALAAHKQGKFKEMHALLFERAPNHSHDEVTKYAQELGLDLAKFEADWQAAGPQVDADRAEGESIGVTHTPMVYFNDRVYEGPPTAKYLGLWIDEELAVNR